MTRRMSPTRRLRIFEAHAGVCCLCDQKIDGTRERWDIHHEIPLEISRNDSDENLKPAHQSCHRAHTAAVDTPRIAKAKRVERKHKGAHRPRSTLPGSKSSPWKIKVDGTVVPRD